MARMVSCCFRNRLLGLGLLLVTLLAGCQSGIVPGDEGQGQTSAPTGEKDGAWFYFASPLPVDAPPPGWSPTFIVSGRDDAGQTHTLAWRNGEPQWRKITPGGMVLRQPLLAPDGKWLAFREDAQASVWMVRSNGGDANRIVSASKVSGYLWTADSHLLVKPIGGGPIVIADPGHPGEEGTVRSEDGNALPVPGSSAFSVLGQGRLVQHSTAPPYGPLTSFETYGTKRVDWVDRETLLLFDYTRFRVLRGGKVTEQKLSDWDARQLRAGDVTGVWGSLVAPKSRLVAIEYSLPAIGPETPKFVAVVQADTGKLVGVLWGGPLPPEITADYYPLMRDLPGVTEMGREGMLSAWSADERYLVVSGGGTDRFVQVKPDGLAEQDPVAVMGEPIAFLTWAPTGHTALVQGRESMRLAIYDPETRKAQPIAVQPDVKLTNVSAAWLP